MKTSRGTKGYRRIVPSLTALVEFEAVGRLFQRGHRSIKLTAEGEALYQVVAESMQKIAGVFDRLSTTGVEQSELVLASTAAFSQFRLLPRLANLKRLNPPLQLRLTTQMFTADLRHVEVDAAVRYGNGQWTDGTSTLLFDVDIFPVCSPRFLEENGVPTSLEQLASMALVESDSTAEGWMDWTEWFRAVGYRPSRLNKVLRCSLYTDAVQAARYGQGIALGWSRLVDDLLMTGELVRIEVATFTPAECYFLVVPHGRTISPVITQLIEWLRGDPATR